MCRNENEVSSCSGVKHCLGVKTAPFPVMSVMNVTTVISNSRGKKNLKMPVHSKPIIFVYCWIGSKILHILIWPVCQCISVYILDQYSEESLALPGLEYRSIGLSDCFEASLEIQISFLLSIKFPKKCTKGLKRCNK